MSRSPAVVYALISLPLHSVTLTVAKSNPLKRKAASDDESESPSSNGISDPIKGEYETGRVICEVCRKGVSFRDEDTGGFTLKHWDAHRLSW
jgi:hypothetical protein